MMGAEIREIRKALSLTQEQFAAILGVCGVTVCRWERATELPSPYRMALIRHFGEAAKRDQAKKVGGVLLEKGVVSALFLLLKLAHLR